MNADSSIGTRCPSVLITGGSNFPVRKKEKQVAAWERNNREWQEIQGIIGKIKSVGTGGISGDDPNALAKLKAKLEEREKHQALMKAANAAIRLKTPRRVTGGCASWAIPRMRSSSSVSLTTAGASAIRPLNCPTTAP